MLIGRVGQIPELRSSKEGNQVANFSLATENYKKETAWHRVVAFKQSADFVGKYVEKGTLLAVEGEIQYRAYEKDGQKKTSTEIIANNVRILSGGKKKDAATEEEAF